MALENLEGQARAVFALRQALSRDVVHHAYLFVGPEGVGKELAAIGFAQALLCRSRPQEGCGECEICQRIAHRNHPDVAWLLPEEEQIARGWAARSDFSHAPSKEIRVEQVRQLQERMVLRPLEGARRVAVVASAHRLTEQAQNAFLKTLEEPPPGTVMILLTAAPSRLLPTIRSRLCTVPFGPLPAEVLAARLPEELGGQAAWIGRLAQGSLTAAEELSPASLARRREIVTRFESLRADDARTWLAAAEGWGKSRESAEEVLRVLSAWSRDCQAAQAGQDFPKDPELELLCRQVGERRSAFRLQREGELIRAAMENISLANGSPRLQLERLLMEVAP